jgi:hypothetical protein
MPELPPGLYRQARRSAVKVTNTQKDFAFNIRVACK